MIPLAEARAWITRRLHARPPEHVQRRHAVGRVLTQDIVLCICPDHAVALVAGLAVRAADTEGATEYAPAGIDGIPVQAGEPMPPGTDAVLERAADNHALTPVARGQGVAAPGHEVPPRAVLPAGTLLTPLHLALLDLAAIPADPLVRARPRIAAGSPLLEFLLAASGIVVADHDPDLVLTEAPLHAIDHHGIAIRPGETTTLGRVGTTPAIGLPAHPAAQATVFALLLAPVLRHIAGRPEPAPSAAALTRKISSSLGLLEAVRVCVLDGAATPLGPADGIGLLAACGANALVLVPEGSEGYPAGAMVPIYPP